MTDFLDRLKRALADRYLIGHELGVGGMATVYLAEDVKHRRKVAVKVMRPEFAASLGAERFLREIEIAAGLNHPHVLPLYDSGEFEGVLWFVMPYVEETLRTKLMREGRLPVGEAVQIARTVATALDYAHQNNIVHRDIKPENILLHEGEPMVTDFGIARAISAAGGTTLTQTGLPIGTPRYMSPEQALGSADLDGRTDIFSLGLVLYEMLVGDPPLTPSDRQSIAEGRITETPSPHRRTLESLPRALFQALSRALADHPADRFSSAKQFAKALTVRRVEGGGVFSRLRVGGFHPADLSRKGVITVVAALAMAAGAVITYVTLRGGGGGPEDGVPIAADRVLVAGFVNETGDSALTSLGRRAADLLTGGLEETGLVRVVDARAVVGDPLGPDTSGMQGVARALALAREVGAGMVVSGAYYRQGDSLQFQAQITETESGSLLGSMDPVTGPLASPTGVVEALKQRVMGAMVTLVDEAWPRGVSNAPTYDAYREYVAGVPFVGQQDYATAIDHFLRASSLDSTFEWPLISAGRLMIEGGDVARADSMIAAVDSIRDRLRTPELRMLDHVAARLRGDHAAALAAVREAANIAPRSDATWELALELLRLNRPAEADSILAQLDPTRGFLRSWWIYWYYRATAHHMQGRHLTELQLAGQGRQQFPDNLGALSTEVLALAASGRDADIGDRLDEAVALTSQTGQGRQTMRTLVQAAMELQSHDHEEAARGVIGRVFTWAENRPPSEAETAEHRTYVALALYLSERWAEAYDRISALAAEDPTNVDFRGYLGTAAARRGDDEQALQVSEWLQGLEGPHLLGVNTLWQARIVALLGEKERALALLGDAFENGLEHVGTELNCWTSRTCGAWLHRDPDFASLGDQPPFQELLRPKGGL